MQTKKKNSLDSVSEWVTLISSAKRKRDMSQEGEQKCSIMECSTEVSAFVGHWPCKETVISAARRGHVQVTQRMPTAVGYIDGREVTVLRDSGYSWVVVRKGLSGRVANGQKRIPFNPAGGVTINVHIPKAKLDCSFYT